MSFIKVKNKHTLRNFSLPKENKTWLEYWEKRKGKKIEFCENSWCTNLAKTAGCVEKYGEKDKAYIIPLCEDCSDQKKPKIFEAWYTDLVQIKDEE